MVLGNHVEWNTFFVNDKEVSKEEFWKFESEQEKKTDVTWYDFDEELTYKQKKNNDIIGAFYHFLDRRTYELNLPQIENLKSISLEQNAKGKVISDNDEMKDIINVLNGVKRITKQESIQDAPINIDNVIKVDFNFIENGASTIFVYKKNNSYYIEQPYNGIYQINGDEYNSIEELVRDIPSTALSMKDEKFDTLYKNSGTYFESIDTIQTLSVNSEDTNYERKISDEEAIKIAKEHMRNIINQRFLIFLPNFYCIVIRDQIQKEDQL